MKKLIVNSLEGLGTALFVLVVLISAIAGYSSNGVTGFLIGLVSGGLFGVITFGLLFLLLEMNDHLRVIRQNLSTKQGTAVAASNGNAGRSRSTSSTHQNRPTANPAAESASAER